MEGHSVRILVIPTAQIFFSTGPDTFCTSGITIFSSTMPNILHNSQEHSQFGQGIQSERDYFRSASTGHKKHLLGLYAVKDFLCCYGSIFDSVEIYKYQET